MREKWNKDHDPRISIEQPIPQRLTVMPESKHKIKLLLKSPSMRAMKNYHDLPIEDDNNLFSGSDNLSFLPESENSDKKYDEPYAVSMTSSYNNSVEDMFSKEYVYDLNNMGTLSRGTTTSGSELNSERNEMGSTAKLVSSKIHVSSKTWFSHLFTVVCTISMTAGLGNIYRLPQTALLRGGLPFLVSYVILTILIGLPLLFLELGIGQLAQEGFIKSWRAVPFFRGVGYIKLLAGCTLSIYYPLYMSMSLYYIIWLLKEQLPFPECTTRVKITTNGYLADGKNGQECLRKTFLKSPFDDPSWFGIYASILFVIWIVITMLSIRRTKSYIRSLSLLFLPTVACYIALTTKSILAGEPNSLYSFVNDIDWSDLTTANTWYFAAIQVFFSTNVGFGSFITNAGIIYNKVNPLWTALGYITLNLIFGVGSVLMCHVLKGNLNITTTSNDVAELGLMSLIYDISSNQQNDSINVWAIITHVLILLAGFINMATITYTLLKAITVQNGNRLKWWQTSIVLSFVGFVLGCLVLLRDDFEIVHLLDHYIVGNLILISVIIEVFVFISFYGMTRIKSDFEFMLGHILSKVWIILWRLLPLLLTGIFAWGLATLPLEGIYKLDPLWLYATGWSVVLLAALFIFIVGFFTVIRQDGYTLKDKLKASLESSNKWGPKDPILRHTWIQWNSKAQKGERDFTLKRRGTREYTRSIKKNMKKAQTTTGDLSAYTSGVYNPNDQNHNDVDDSGSNYVEPCYIRSEPTTTIIRINNHDRQKPLRVTSLVDSLNSPHHNHDNTQRSSYPGNINPLARTINYEEFHDSSNSEGYGTFRKGPYIISNDNMNHVCYRKYSQNEIATEL